MTFTRRTADRKIPGRLVALLAALLLAAAACSAADEPEAATTETEPLATELETDATETVEPLATETTEATPDGPTEPTDAATDSDTTTDAATGADGGDGAGMTGDDIAAALQDAGLTTVAAAVQASGLGDELARLPSFTVFAPNDEAFTTLGADVLTMDTAELEDTLSYHVTEERFLTADFGDETQVDTLEGSPLTITSDGGTVTVGDGATVTQADIEIGDSGVVHVIDQVLEPGA